MAEIIPITSISGTRPGARAARPRGRPLAGLAESRRPSLEAATKSPKTIRSFTGSADALIRYLRVNDLPGDAEGVEAAYFRRFLISERERTSAASAAVHFRNLSVFFNWLIARARAPGRLRLRPEDAPKLYQGPGVREDDQRALLAACTGNDFEERRGTAIIRILIDNGVRVSGLGNIPFDAVDLTGRVLKVTLHGETSCWRRRPRRSTGTSGSGPGTRRRPRRGYGSASRPAWWDRRRTSPGLIATGSPCPAVPRFLPALKDRAATL